MAQDPTVLSLFSGAGGLDLGFAAAGFRSVGFVEIESWACETLRANNPDAWVIGPPDYSGDINEIGAKELAKVSADLVSPDVVIGGPPCQPYSVAAAQRFLRGDDRFKRTGHADESRGGLFREFYRIVAETSPKAFVLENVPGLLELDDGASIGAMVQDLEGLGYNVAVPSVVQAADFGVPQYRRRLFVLGALKKAPQVPSGIFGNSDSLLPPHRTVAEALASMPASLPNNTPRNHANASIARYKKLKFGEREKLGRVDRLDPYRPSKTVIAGGTKGGGRSHLHPFLARTLTVRECARLQTFPDSMVFNGNISRQFTQVGNAVPPLLGEHMARAVGTAMGMKFDTSPASAPYLERAEHLDDLVASLLEGAIAERSDWLYSDIDLPSSNASALRAAA